MKKLEYQNENQFPWCYKHYALGNVKKITSAHSHEITAIGISVIFWQSQSLMVRIDYY